MGFFTPWFLAGAVAGPLGAAVAVFGATVVGSEAVLTAILSRQYVASMLAEH